MSLVVGLLVVDGFAFRNPRLPQSEVRPRLIDEAQVWAQEFVPDVLFVAVLKPREVGWKDDPNGPRRQRTQQARVLLKEPVKIIERAT